MGKLGIIGGMGPMATQLLYKRIIEKTDASCDQEHIDMIILNHSAIPDRTAAIKSGNTDAVYSLLLEDAKMLHKNGASVIAIPCNTSHYFWERLQSETEIPIINMVRKTVQSIKNSNPDIKKIGLLATDGTVFTGIYKKECEALGIECVNPREDIQKIVMDIIYNQIKVGKKGSREDFSKIDAYLKESGCEAAILACTELSCFRENHGLSDFYVDALEVLSDEAIIMSGAKIRKEN